MKRRSVLAALTAVALPATGCLESSPSVPASAPRYQNESDVQLGDATADVHGRESVTNVRDDRRSDLRCACVAADAVREYVYGQLDETRGVSVGCGWPPGTETPDESLPFAVIVHHMTAYGREGGLISEPAVSYEELVAVTPRVATATRESPDREQTCTVPVYVETSRAYVD